METINPTILQGKRLRLEPLQQEHYSALKSAADDPRIWEFTVSLGHGPHFDQWWMDSVKGMQDQHRIPYVVVSKDSQEVIGSTSFLNLALADRRLEIGNTWYVPRVWASQVNPECKLLLMTFAFEELNIRRVELCVDAINLRSRAAVAKLGAVQEGTLRSHRFTQTGRIRDTVYYSILASEWPTVKERLLQRLL